MPDTTSTSSAAKSLARALFIEDSAMEMRLVNELMKRAHVQYEGHWVSTGEDALHFLRNSKGYEDAPRPDVIFLDLNLPRIKGEGVLQMLRDDPVLKDIPVVILSGSDFEDDIINAREQGAAHYVVKPLNLDKLNDVVARIARLRLEPAGDDLLLCVAA